MLKILLEFTGIVDEKVLFIFPFLVTSTVSAYHVSHISYPAGFLAQFFGLESSDRSGTKIYIMNISIAFPTEWIMTIEQQVPLHIARGCVKGLVFTIRLDYETSIVGQRKRRPCT